MATQTVVRHYVDREGRKKISEVKKYLTIEELYGKFGNIQENSDTLDTYISELKAERNAEEQKVEEAEKAKKAAEEQKLKKAAKEKVAEEPAAEEKLKKLNSKQLEGEGQGAK